MFTAAFRGGSGELEVSYVSITRVLDKQNEGCEHPGERACRSNKPGLQRATGINLKNSGESQKGIYRLQYHGCKLRMHRPNTIYFKDTSIISK